MAIELPMVLPDSKMLNLIREELREDPKRLARQMELFQEWLTCETHLPKDVDAHLIENFIRLCKCDLQKAKRKFEQFLAARMGPFRSHYSNRITDENYFKTFPVHKLFVTYPQLTPDGYKVCYFNFPKSVEEFNFFRTIQAVLFLLDFWLFQDTFAGCITVYDFQHFTAQHLGKIDLGVSLDITNMVCNICPLRIKHIHLLNVPIIALALIELVKKVLSNKLAKRMLTHPSSGELLKYIPENVIPVEYGGTGKSLDLLAEEQKSYFLENKNWSVKTENLKFIGPVPSNRKDLFSLDEYQMEGSFRKLEID